MSSYAQPSGLRSSRKWLLNTLLATASVSAVAAIAPHANAQEAAGSSCPASAPMRQIEGAAFRRVLVSS